MDIGRAGEKGGVDPEDRHGGLDLAGSEEVVSGAVDVVLHIPEPVLRVGPIDRGCCAARVVAVKHTAVQVPAVMRVMARRVSR